MYSMYVYEYKIILFICTSMYYMACVKSKNAPAKTLGTLKKHWKNLLILFA